MSEDAIQSEIVAWFNSEYPKYRGLFFHVNNNPRNRVDGARLARMGLVPGIPDLLLLANGTVYGFELKTETGKLSQWQEKVHAIWRGAGFKVYIVRNLKDFQEIITQILDTY